MVPYGPRGGTRAANGFSPRATRPAPFDDVELHERAGVVTPYSNKLNQIQNPAPQQGAACHQARRRVAGANDESRGFLTHRWVPPKKCPEMKVFDYRYAQGRAVPNFNSGGQSGSRRRGAPSITLSTKTERTCSTSNKLSMTPPQFSSDGLETVVE